MKRSLSVLSHKGCAFPPPTEARFSFLFTVVFMFSMAFRSA
jgi:hypothetical protein